MSDLPKIAAYKPHYVELEKDKRYFWCACGLSNRQPFCDGSHKGTGLEPITYTGQYDGEEVLFCACKHTSNGPFCDGSHNNLREQYETDDPASDANRAIPEIARSANGITRLDGLCYVTDVTRLSTQNAGHLQISNVISPETGAQHQSQYLFTAGDAWSDPVAFGQHDVLLFIAAGQGEINISGQKFDMSPLSGAYVKPSEAFALKADDKSQLDVFVSVCPVGATPNWLDSMPDNFSPENAQRVIPFAIDNRQGMADRFFQVLVDKTQGCTNGTQFIGEIPQSKAVLHRHLYEESLIIVKGEGMMWTNTKKTPVTAGDVIFLPRKEAHSLECLSEDGMLVAGVIYPGDNPAINY